MIEINKNVFVGNSNDYEWNKFESDFYFLQACKEPYHRQALGYKGRSISDTHPEYLFAYRGNRLILNIVDTDSDKYFSNILFEKSLDFIEYSQKKGNKILIHCNQGLSRSPSIGLLYLAVNNKISNHSFLDAEKDFVELYPDYAPKGIKSFLANNWQYFIK
ncbi:dual specificity protein phosphatase family protein [Salegentibacter flavus]|uniref:Dual specificity phosphatase, catalytic domain n=1 Tax=Salegentibacter flavus TaxID=287099 RepID=A0A1I5DJV5_9FLAO|nr:dual specificity protein phosphatase [Salegentibacter flavus]SFN99512.1 Dual specificity phosphatase, catalytic domain [Salegentibacter flavus]